MELVERGSTFWVMIMELIEKYKTYRKIGMELNSKIIKSCLNRDVIMESARLLGITCGDILVLDDEEKIDVLMDFALNEYTVNNKNLVESYQEKIGWQNEIEKEIMDALLSSYTSLFEVVSVSEAEKTLLLDDILNKKSNIKLTDINFSETAISGTILFTRLISFKDFNMTSGVSFVFPGDLKAHLIREYKQLNTKIKSDSESIKRFISFFILNKIDSIEAAYV
jgi:hypothetical protein